MLLAAHRPAGSIPGDLILTDAEFHRIRTWLYEVAGIHLADSKRVLVTTRLSKRLSDLGLVSYSAYIDRLRDAQHDAIARAECQIALNLLTTNETYFFREPAHFDLVRTGLIPEWRGRRVRCWSAACSTGEEAYTLAMVLAQQGLADWSILGTDINSEVVARAVQGIYPLARTQGIHRDCLHRYCRKGIGSRANTFRVVQGLRSRVQFQLANLLESQAGLGEFDLILLRNVLIYFDPASKQRVLDNVVRQLKPGGVLMVGHAESVAGSEGLVPMSPSVYRRERRKSGEVR